MKTKITAQQRRKLRTRARIRKIASGHPRLTVFRSGMHMHAQVIDDAKGVTLAACSTMEKDLKAKLKNKTANKDAAAAVGKLVAERALKAGVTEIAFDRGACIYHGRVKALAESAREAGLKF